MAESDSLSATLIGTEDRSDAPRLCLTCTKIDLSVDKFVISSQAGNSGSPDGAGTAAEAAGRVRLTSGNVKRALDRVGKVYDRRHICRLCELAWGAVERYSGANAVDSNAEIFLTWEVDGRQRTPQTDRLVNRTRRIRLTWQERSGKEETVYLVFVAPTGARRLNSDAYATKATDTHFLGRGLFDTREKQALMKSWIDLCVEKHGPDCQNKHGRSSEFRKLVASTYFGVIDVVDMQLKPLPIVNGRPERYVALSYVWGTQPPGQKPYTTTRANVMVHIQHGGLEKAWDKVPRTLQDTILLVSRLGERYVWIDSLCIVQDSNSSWELNAKSMHLVYGNAHFTICAADGDAETGLRAVDAVLRTPEPGRMRSTGSRGVPMSTPSSTGSARSRQRASSPFPATGSGTNGSSAPTKGPGMQSPLHTAAHEMRQHLRAADEANQPPLTAECLPGIRLLVARPTEAVIQDSPWNQRGWTFQERLLSRRCLIFAEGHVYFQCRSAVISQHIFTDGGGANGWSLDWTNSPLRTLGELRRRAFWFYMKCIQLYTGRELSKPKDVLTAFQGAAWLLEDRMNAPLLYGLPSSHFDLALLWMPLQKLERRRRRLPHHHRSYGSAATAPPPTCTQDDMGNCTCRLEEDGFGARDFPSWSWCGWMGGKAAYPFAMVEGCLQNVQEWLRHHTWILWHFRDHEGNLRPLWDMDHLVEDGSEEFRWKGYAGRAEAKPTFASVSGPRRRRIASNDRYHPGRGSHRGMESRPPPPHAQWSRSSNVAYLERLTPGYYEDGDGDDRDRMGPPLSMRLYPNGPGASTEDADQRTASQNHDVVDHRGLSTIADVRRHSARTHTRSVPPPPPPRTRYRPHPPEAFVSAASPHGIRPPAEPPSHPFRPSPPVPPPGLYEDIGSSHRPAFMDTGVGDVDRGNGPPVSTTDSDSESTARSAGRISDSDSDDRSGMSADHHGGTDPPPGNRDPYGRIIRPSVADRVADKFTGLLPDNPFGVDRGPFDERQGLAGAMPILQFWTWRTELFVAVRSRNGGELGDRSSGSPPCGGSADGGGGGGGAGELCQCSIVDKAGDWCGSIVLPYDWIARREGIPLMFIALSDARGFTGDECPVWNYYIPKEKEESEWDLYFVMLLERNKERALWERVAVGKVFQAAFGDAVWDEIKLG
jgi:hypothetical protein